MPVSLSQIVGVALALAVVYYVLGLMVSALTKLVLEAFETRGKVFEEFLKNGLLEATEVAKKGTLEKLKQMPQINALRPVRYKYGGFGIFTGETKLSDYVERIPPKSLVDALFDLEGTAKSQTEKIKNVINLLPKEFVGLNGEKIPFASRASLLNMADANLYTFEQWHDKFETWFGTLMDQSAQQFKTKAIRWVLAFAILLAFALGVDTIEIAQRSWVDASFSKTIDAKANVILASTNDENTKNADLQKLYGDLDALKVINFPFWVQPAPKEATTPEPYAGWLLRRILGLLITGIAVSQGSSFWYDIIRNIKGDQKTTGSASKEPGVSPTAPLIIDEQFSPRFSRNMPSGPPDK